MRNRNRRSRPFRGPRPRFNAILNRAVIYSMEALERRTLLAAGDPYINEFVASNTAGLVDDKGNHSDWVELYNPAATSAVLNNWHLTDDSTNPTKWTFPA